MGDEREGRGEQQLSQREAWRVRVAVMVECSRRMGVLGRRGRVAKRPSWREVDVDLGLGLDLDLDLKLALGVVDDGDGG